MEENIYKVPENWAKSAFFNKQLYREFYSQSIKNPDEFWRKQADRIEWIKKPTIIKNTSFDPVNIKWFEDGVLNVTISCLDRHLKDKGEQIALIWEPDDPNEQNRIFTYKQLLEEVSKWANVLKKLNVKKGDRVTIYLPMIPEAAFAMLACARIGAIHSVVFAGFSPDSLAGRINDCDSTIIITADEGRRGGKTVPLKKNVDEAAKLAPRLKTSLIVKHSGGKIDWHGERDIWWHEISNNIATKCEPEPMGAEEALFILYTSGSTGKPKGVVHTSGGYLTYISLAFEAVFDYKGGDIYWCGADLGWITGHSFTLYAPLANGATTLMFEGVPNYPDASRYWQIIDKYKVNQFFTAPTAIRALMAAGDEYVDRTDRSSLKLLATAGEPINPEAWEWYYNKVGKGNCRLIDNYWQTETGGMLLTPLPGATNLKPGSATFPFFGIKPQLVDDKGNILEGAACGNLCILDSWPSQARTIYNDHQRFVDTYFSTYKGKYFTSDGARRDEDGYFWITGRVDDVINVAGHRLGTAEIESALVAHEKVAEAAVVGFNHEIKGQGIYAYISLMANAANNIGENEHKLKNELKQWVRKEIGPIATPDFIHFTANLPKTRSGKIMRRILRKIAENDFANLGDISTLADPDIIEQLINSRQNMDKL